MVYAHTLTGQVAQMLAKTYNLKAGAIVENDAELKIPLLEYLQIRKFNGDFKDPEIQNMDLNELTWNRVLKNHWLNKFAEEKDLVLSNEEVDQYIGYYIEDLDGFKQSVENDFGVSYDDYKHFIIESGVLEAKVYNYLISNYNDMEGVSKAQGAYEALEAGQDFYEVAKTFSEEMAFVEGSVFLSEDQMIDVYEPIKDLKVGEFSRIVYIPFPTGYVIWYVASDVEEEGKALKEVKAIFVNALPLDDFFNAYLESVKVEKYY